LQLFLNGSTTASFSNQLSGTLAPGATIIYKNINATIYSGAATTSTSVDFNGDDAIALYKISTASYVDIFGRIGEDPGTAWTSGTTTTLDKTLIRLPNVTSGVTTNPTTGFPSLATQWIISDVDDVSDLGSHSFNSTNLVDSYVSGYQSKAIAGQTTNTTTVTGLAASTIYYYRLRAKNGSIISANSNTIATSCSSLITPTFTQVASSCPGVNLSPLPTTSNNGITGTWSPALNNTATTTYTFTPTSSQCAATANMTITIGCASIVHLKLFIEGYYDASTQLMRPVKVNQSVSVNNQEVEVVTINLHDAVNFNLVATTTAQLMTNGTANCIFNSVPNGSYYIVIKGSNFIQTSSFAPQIIGVNATLDYDFTTASSKAYGNNMIQVNSGVWAFYSGDLNQDEMIDASDYVIWEEFYNNFSFGEEATDLNGDGAVDASDYVIWENNYNGFVMGITP
jgi:hypothetical protein